MAEIISITDTDQKLNGTTRWYYYYNMGEVPLGTFSQQNTCVEAE